MTYKETITKTGNLHTKRIKHTPTTKTLSFTKDSIRKDIQNEVFDIEDSVADNAKMISLLITLSSRIYDILDTVQKDKLATGDRYLIEYIFAKFSTTETRADVQLVTEGTPMLDKLLERQSIIGNIIKRY